MPDGKRFAPRPTTEKQKVANLTKLVALRAGTESHMARLATLHGKSVTIATGSTLPLQSFSARNRVGLLLVDTRFQVGILRVRQERSAA